MSVTLVPRALSPRWLRFAWELARRDLRTRYAGSAVGFAWNILLPVSTILVYLFLFTQVFERRFDASQSPGQYAVFLCAGLLPWIAFIDIVQRAPSVFTAQAGVMKRLPVPKLTIVFGAALSSALTLTISLLALSAALAVGFADGDWRLPLVAIALVPLQFALTAGLGMSLSMLGVFVRDTTAVLPLITQIAFWLTPILYPVAAVPEKARAVLAVAWNFQPFYGMLRCFQTVIAEGRFPATADIAHLGAWLVLSCGFGALVFKAHHASLADLL